MIVHFVFLTVACFFVRANSVENVYPDNGWQPMSIEKVLKLQRDFIKTPSLHLLQKTLQNSPKRPTVIDDFENNHFVQIIQTNEINKKPIEDNQVIPISEKYEYDRNGYNDLIKTIQPPYKEKITLEDTASNWDIQNHATSKLQRKAKKINDSNFVVNFNNAITDQNKINKKEDKTDERNIGIVSNKTYEVKENIQEENHSASNPKLLYNQELKYVSQKSATVNARNNLTANLLDILANYNIGTSDNLRNYDKSLRQNNRNSPNYYAFSHVPEKLPIRYNNANHLPIDPLLAVFLSNYGHYIPSLYGFHGSYNNLYGYLASNNIHNNKPFGSYKIFSDTDSLH